MWHTESSQAADLLRFSLLHCQASTHSVSTVWGWSIQKISQLCHGAQKLDFTWATSAKMPGLSQNSCFGSKSSGRVPKTDDQSERYDCKESLSEQAQSARMSAWRQSVLAAEAKRQEVWAKTYVSPPGLHPSLGGWPEATVCQIGQSLWCTGWAYSMYAVVMFVYAKWVRAAQRWVCECRWTMKQVQNLWHAEWRPLQEQCVMRTSWLNFWTTLPSVLQCFDAVGWATGRASGLYKNWVVGCWRGYLSGVRCRLAYGPADATATHCLLLQ